MCARVLKCWTHGKQCVPTVSSCLVCSLLEVLALLILRREFEKRVGIIFLVVVMKISGGKEEESSVRC